MKPRTRATRFVVISVLLSTLFLSRCAIHMPGTSFRGRLQPATEQQISLADQLKDDVTVLAGRIGERNVFHPEKLAAAEDFIAASLAKSGYQVNWAQTYETRIAAGKGVECSNLEAVLPGTGANGIDANEIVIIGAHYDAVHGSPAANDNASGTAACLALARAFASNPQPRTIRFVFFVNEEPPFFWTRDMGSLRYAEDCHARSDKIVGMISLETMGYFTDEKNSQDYPPPLSLAYPSTGNFIGFVGMSESEIFIKRCVRFFREKCDFPSEGAAMPSLVPRIAASDHWSFWKQGYPSLMVTDTAPYRYPHYHKPTDTPDKLNYDNLARVVVGLEAVVRDLTNSPVGDSPAAPPRPSDNQP